MSRLCFQTSCRPDNKTIIANAHSSHLPQLPNHSVTQLLNCDHNLIDDSDYQDTSTQQVDFRNQHHSHTMVSRIQITIGSQKEQKESEPSRMSISDVKNKTSEECTRYPGLMCTWTSLSLWKSGHV